MNKPFTIGGIPLDLPEVDADITRSLDGVTHLHEQGQIKSLLMVFTQADGKIGFSMCGDSLHFPMLSLVATGVVENVEESILVSVLNDHTTNIDSDEDENNEEGDD
jgi:hypothetical protein